MLEMEIDCDMYLSVYKVVVSSVGDWIIRWAHQRQCVPLLKVSAASVVISTWYQSVTRISLIYGSQLQLVQL